MPKKYKFKKQGEKSKSGLLNYKFKKRGEEPKRRERSPEQRAEHKKLALFLVGWFILVAAVYFAFTGYFDGLGSDYVPVGGIIFLYVYLILGVVFFLLWLVFNGGFKKFDAERYEKPDEMGYDEFCGIIEKLKERQRKSKYFMALFMPFVIVMPLDFLIMRWF
ncbi:MAG: hypothetical protein FWH10_07790 [Oscillospiraceae bacterium]|nr:hypothetical protein [Oscillospiraceae bacterium]